MNTCAFLVLQLCASVLLDFLFAFLFLLGVFVVVVVVEFFKI